MREYWNRIHAQMRSRVKRRHAHLLKWRFLQYNSFQELSLEEAILTIISVEAFIGFARPCPYPNHTTREATKLNLTRCNCKYGTAEYSASYKECLLERRHQAIAKFVSNYAPPKRLAKKRKKVPGSSGTIDFVRLIAQPDCESSTDFESSDED